MTKLLCPHCGAPVDDFADIDIRRLSKLQTRTLEALVAGRNRFVSTSTIVDQVYADDPEGGPDDAGGCVKVLISKLRRKLLEQGWAIDVHWGVGYRLVKLDGEKAAAQ